MIHSAGRDHDAFVSMAQQLGPPCNTAMRAGLAVPRYEASNDTCWSLRDWEHPPPQPPPPSGHSPGASSTAVALLELRAPKRSADKRSPDKGQKDGETAARAGEPGAQRALKPRKLAT